MVEGDDACRAHELLHERDAPGVVLPLNRRVIVERGACRGLTDVLGRGRGE